MLESTNKQTNKNRMPFKSAATNTVSEPHIVFNNMIY